MIKRLIALILIMSILLVSISGCSSVGTHADLGEGSVSNPQIDSGKIAETINTEIKKEQDEKGKEEKNANEEITNEEDDQESYNTNLDLFVYDKIFDEFGVPYETFNASVILEDGTEVYGIGYSDLSACLSTDSGDYNYFPAGFITDVGDIVIPEDAIDNGLEINNLDYQNDKYGFVYAYKTDPLWYHCVIENKYLKYGINDNGVIDYETSDYSEETIGEVIDEDLGNLYSYDENGIVYYVDIGEYVEFSGESLFETIDYKELEAEVNRILEDQDKNFARVDVETYVYRSKDIVDKYFLSLQEETFMGCKVQDLIKEVEKLDPRECITITSDGNVIVNLDKDVPKKPSAVAKWTVGITCGILVVGSVALTVFVPAALPASGAISGAAIDAFMQVVLENQAVENINWKKIAVASVTGAILAWACPLGAGAITETVATKTGSVALSKLAGYGFFTFSNGLVSGASNAAQASLDGRDDILDAFTTGAIIGAVCTLAAVGLSEVGQVAMKALSSSHPENWFVKVSNGTAAFIKNNQVHLNNEKLESILVPKSIYEASKAGVHEYNLQKALNGGMKGGRYADVKVHSNGTYTEVHETPSFDSTGAAKRQDGPSIKMAKEDHRKTASYGNSREAQQYRNKQKMYIEKGDYRSAIQMDIDDMRSKFDDKYDDAIAEMLEYAARIGWW